MTREEALNECVSRDKAIVQLDHLLSDWDDDWNIAIRKCIEAIKKLPSVTPQPCGDCISREETLKTLMDEWTEYDRELIGWLFEKIDKLPPVTAQPKMGKWIKYGVPRCGEQHYKCTACGYYVNFGQWGELYTREFKYCPHCGCAMQEVEE